MTAALSLPLCCTALHCIGLGGALKKLPRVLFRTKTSQNKAKQRGTVCPNGVAVATITQNC